MAVKVATKITLSPKAISKALIDKTTPRYANETRWGGFSYDEVIYPQARTVFEELYPIHQYPTNEEFTEKFKKDFYKHDPALQKIINQGEHEIIFNKPEKTEEESKPHLGGEPAGTMTETPAFGDDSSNKEDQESIQQSETILTPATDKAERLAQENPATAKILRENLGEKPNISSIKTGSNTGIPKIFEDAFKNEPEFKTNPNLSINNAEKTEPSDLPNLTTNPGVKYKTGFTNTLKNISSSTGTFFQRNVGKHLTAGRVATGAGALIGGLTGAGLTGGSSMGAFSGAIGGAALSSWARSGGATNFLNKAGGLEAVSNLSNPIGSRGLLGKNNLLKNSSRRVLFMFLGFFIIFGVFVGILGGIGGGGFSTTAPIGNIGMGTGTITSTTTDLMSCKFGRAGDGANNERSYNSPLLLSYIQEASALTSIPPAVLAAFIRVETGTTVSKTDAEILALSSVSTCPRNPVDGGLGVMQLQPKGKLGHYKDGIANGARLIGRNYDDLTEEDYCDVKKNIIMGAGFILKKLQVFGYGDGTAWNPEWTTNQVVFNAMATGYYGCLRYGSNGPCSDPGRIYDYGKDLWDSVQACKVTSATSNLPTTGSPKLDKIISTATQISSTLTKNGRYYSAKPDEPGVYYYCTFLVVDSYRSAGLNDMTRASHGAVVNMKSFFANTAGYRLAPGNIDVRSLRPGDVVILEGEGNQHASIIKSIELNPDGTGAGTITTLDANNIETYDTISVRGFKATKASFASRYDITGFGQITQN